MSHIENLYVYFWGYMSTPTSEPSHTHNLCIWAFVLKVPISIHFPYTPLAITLILTACTVTFMPCHLYKLTYTFFDH